MLARRPIPRVLSRHNLILGGERNLVLTAALLTVGLGASAMNLTAIVVCTALWFAALAVFRWMAKADPQMSSVYRRSLNYRGFYPAFSRPYRDMSAFDKVWSTLCKL
jgi:type IV secretion system protein TrbD